MKATFSKTIQQTVKVTNVGGVLTAQSPITLKNYIGAGKVAAKLVELQDVSVVDQTDASTLVYNSSNGLYEVKKMDIDAGEY